MKNIFTFLSGLLIALVFPATLYAQNISTIAGNGTAGYTGDGGPAATAELSGPNGVAVDPAGNIYISDRFNNCIRKVNTSGVISTFAGTGVVGSGGDGFAATLAQLNNPTGVAVDASGNVFIADRQNNRIRKVNTSGIISTFAGTGTYIDDGDGGAASAANCAWPANVACDATGNVYIACEGGEQIRKVNTLGIISTIAGTGSAGYGGDGGLAISATFNAPYGIAVDAAGNIYIGDYDNSRVRKINTSGFISSFAGNGTAGYTGDGGAAATAEINNVWGVSVDGSGNVYIADGNNFCVRKVNTAGIISTIAGTGIVGYTGDGGPATAAQLNNVGAVVLDPTGNIYLADAGNNVIRKIGGPCSSPVISSITPATGFPASSVTITGTGFNTTAASDVVYFGATQATVSAASGTSLTVTVPSSATYFPVTVDNLACNLTGFSQYPFLPTYNNSGDLTSVANFDTHVDFADAEMPYWIAIGDIDGDGKPDLVAANNTSSGTISVFRNTSTSGSITSGSFAAKVDFTAGTNAVCVAIGDVDGDGKPDMVAVNYYTNTVSVYRNTSTSGSITTGSFAPKVDFATGTNPNCVAIGDMDGDGKADIVVLNQNGNTISVFRNTSTPGSITAGSFAPKVDFATGNYPCVVAIGDLDGDGKPDIAATNLNDNTVSVIRNTSTPGSITSGSFATKVDFTTGVQPYGLTISDLDGDGKQDLAITNRSPNSLSVIRNISTPGSITSGSFAAKVDFTTGPDPYSVAAGDFNGDGKPDLAVVNAGGSNTVSVFLNTSTSGSITSGSFSAKEDFTAGGACVAVGDLDGDGKPDIAVAGSGANVVSVLRNDPQTLAECYVPTSGLVAWYPFTGNANDSSGNGYNGTNFGATLTTDRFGHANSAYSFNGSSSYIDVPYTAAFNQFPVSINVWVNSGTPQRGGIVSRYVNCSDNGYELYQDAGGYYSGYYFSQNGSMISLDGLNFATLNDGTWKMLTTIYANDSAYNYVNGTLVAKYQFQVLSPHPNAPTTTTDLIFGYMLPGGCLPLYFNGKIDDIGLWNRPLTACEIAQLYNASCGALSAGTITGGAASICVGGTTTFSDATFGGVWSSTNSSVATINSSGLATGVGGGVTTISYTVVTSCGTAAATQVLTVNATPVVAALSGPSTVCPGSTITLTDATGGGTWSSSNPSAATVVGGVVTGVAAGNTVISYTVSGGCTGYAFALIDVGNEIITTIAGNGTGGSLGDGGAATLAEINNPYGIAVDASGNVYEADWNNAKIRKISTAGIIITYAGTGVSGYFGDGGPATNAKLAGASGLAIDAAGNLYLAEEVNSVIRKISTSGIISTVAGTGTSGYSGDGTAATNATLNGCSDVAIDGAGNLYIADHVNNVIRKVIVSTGLISTIAGTGVPGYFGDGGPATAAKLSGPQAVAVDGNGNLFILDDGNNVIRKVNGATNIISTFAGNGTSGFFGDGTNATSAEFNTPYDITVDAAGDVYIADAANNRIRFINTAGVISTIAGSALTTFGGDSGPATAAGVIYPEGITLDASGNLFISDAADEHIRKVAPAGTAVAAVTGSSSTVCVGATLPLADVTAGGTWSSNAPGTASVGTSGIVTGVASGTATISYTVAFTCGNIYSVYPITVNPIPAAPAPITGSTTICNGATVTLNDATPGGVWTSVTTTVATVPTGAGNVTGVGLGTSVIKYTISNSCGSNAATVNVTVVAAPGPITGTLSACVGGTSLLADGGGGTWSSSAPATASIGTTGLVTANLTGNTTITYTLSGVCTATAIFTVNAAPAAITPPGAVTMCVGATASLGDVTPGGTWSSAAPGTATVGTSGTVTGVAAGTVNILYTTGLGCAATKSVTVLPTPAALSPAGAAVCVGGTATFTESVGGGIWSSVAPATATIAAGVVTGVAAGTTSISYTIGTCAVGAPVTVNANPAAITPAGPVNICVGATASLGDITPGGTWSSAAPGTATVGTSGTVTGVAAGTVNILYTTGAGCSATKSITVLSTPTALSPASATVCTGFTVAFTESVGGGIWSSTSGAVASVSAGLVTGLTVGTTNISYTIGACAVGAPVTVNLSPSAGVILGPATLCIGSPVTYTDATPGGTWSSSNPAIATIGTSGLATGLTPGTTTLSYAVTNGCGTATATQVVTVTSAASAGTIIGASTVCAGTFTILVDTTAGGTWSATNGNATISATGLLTGVNPGTDTIKYSVTNGCGTVSATDIVTVGPLLSAGTITGPSFVCVGSSVTLTDATGAGIWSASNSSATVSGGIVTGVTAGVDTISYTISASCGAAIATRVVTVVPIPDAGTITGPVIVCAGFITTYTDAAAGGVWGITNTSAAISGGGVVTALMPGTDTITYIVTNLCGSAEAEAAVSIGPAISAGTITGPGAVCAGSAIALTDPASGGVWSMSNSHATIIAGIVTGVSAGIDTVYYTVTGSCGTVSASASVVVNPLPSAGTVSGPATLCIGTPATYTDAAPGGVWSVSNSHAGITSGGLATPLSIGMDTVYYSVSNSCGTANATEAVSVLGALSAGTITGAGAVCVGSAITLADGVPGGAWSASNGNATVSAGVVTGVASGTDVISYTVTGSCGSASATKTITIDAMPSAGTITGPSNVCLGSPVTLTDGATGGAWSASNPSATVSIAGLVTAIAPGTDTINYTVTNSCGSVAATYVVAVSTSLPSAGSITGPSNVCAGSTIPLMDAVTGGVWGSSNATATVSGGVVTGVTPGMDTITYTVTNACGLAMASAPVTVGAALVTGAISGPAGVCIGATITLTDAAPGGTWSSSNADATVAGGVVTGVSSGTATISYTVSGSCGTASATWIIAVSVAPSAGTIAGPTGVCAGSTITLTDATPGGVWSASNTRATVSSGVVTGASTGPDTIRYVVTNACGIAVAQWPISVNGAPSAGSISGPASVCPGATSTLVHSGSGGTWSSSNTGLATVSSTGVVTGIATGSLTISYSLSNSCGHSNATHPMTVLSSTSCGGTNTLVGGPGANAEDELSVMPNPNNGLFVVKLTSSIEEQVHVVITNLIGQKVKELNTATNTATEVQMSQAAGIYMLTATTESGSHVTKVIINR